MRRAAVQTGRRNPFASAEGITQASPIGGFPSSPSREDAVVWDKETWNRIMAHIQQHSDVAFSHTNRPECARALCPSLGLFKEKTP